MPTNWLAGSAAKPLLYSHYKALDMVHDMGLIPVRLFRVLFPLWRVGLEGRRRVEGEFDELEWFLERGILELGLQSGAELATFFGLETRLVQMLLEGLRQAGHLAGEDGRLELTMPGRLSVRDRVRYEEQVQRHELYFDGLGSRPLSEEHLKIAVLDELPEKTPFQAFYHFERSWRPEVLQELIRSGQAEGIPSDSGFGLPEEIRAVELLSPRPVYMPAYFVEAREKSPSSPLRLLVFSAVRGLRDTLLEQAVNRDAVVYRSLKARTEGSEAGRGGPDVFRGGRAEAVRRYFEQKNVPKDAWYLNEDGPWGAQVMVDGDLFSTGESGEVDEASQLTLRSVGRYLLVYDWCICVVCDNPVIRRKAVLEQVLDWLQNANARPSVGEVRQRVAGLFERLNLPEFPLQAEALSLARRRGWLRAAERLEQMDLLDVN